MKGILMDFGLPALLMTFCFILLVTGIDSEVKSILTMSAGWMFHAGVARRKK